MKKTIFKQLVFLALFSVFLISCRSSPPDIFRNVENTEQYDIMSLAAMDDNFSKFVNLVRLSGLDLAVEFVDKPITMFIPTNEAFENLDKERYEQLKDPQNKMELRQVLMRHILPSEVPLRQFNNLQIIETAVDEEITVSSGMMGSNSISIGGAEIIKADIDAANGIIHIVNAVIEPNVDVVR